MYFGRAVSWSFLTHACKGFAVPIAATFIAFYLDLETQGYLYTFISLLAIQFLFELGFTQIIITFIAYEANHLRKYKNFFKGKYTHYLRMKEIINFSIHWFRYAAFLYLLILIFVGIFVFADANKAVNLWLWPFLMMALISSIEVLVIPYFGIKEGMGFVDEVFKLRFFKVFLQSSSYLLFIYLGFGIWSLPLSLLFACMINIYFLGKNKKLFISLSRLSHQKKHFNWKSEMLPMQYRIGIGAIAGYLTFSLFTPMTFKLLGAELAGKVGLTIALVSGITNLAVAPSMVASQRIASLVEQRKSNEVQRLVRNLIVTSFLIHLVALIALMIIYNFLGNIYSEILNRALSPALFICYFFAFMLSKTSLPMGIYLRAHKQEPLLWLSIVTGLFVSLGSFFTIQLIGAKGPPLIYLAMGLISFSIFLIYYKSYISKKNYI